MPVRSKKCPRSTSRPCSRASSPTATSASREPLYRRYDAVVRGCTVLPRGAADAGVLAPVPGSRLGVALAVAGNPRYGRIDAGYAAELAVIEAMSCVVAVGARPLGLTNCLNFGNPRKPDQYGEFVAAVDGLARAAEELDLPIVSGNVSLYNETSDGRAIPASAIVACIGALEDVGPRRNAGAQASRVRRCCGSAAASWSSAVRCWPICWGSKARCRAIAYAAERAAIAIVQDAIERGVAAFVPRDSWTAAC